MTKKEKIQKLISMHPAEYYQTYREELEKISEQSIMLCVCGSLATGLHERGCRKMRTLAENKTFDKLKNLL